MASGVWPRVTGGALARAAVGAGTTIVVVTVRGALWAGAAGWLDVAGVRRPAGPACGCADGDAGASPLATDSGADDNPMRWPATWLAAHATAAVTAMPSKAAAPHSKVRRFISSTPYGTAG